MTELGVRCNYGLVVFTLSNILSNPKNLAVYLLKMTETRHVTANTIINFHARRCDTLLGLRLDLAEVNRFSSWGIVVLSLLFIVNKSTVSYLLCANILI